MLSRKLAIGILAALYGSATGHAAAESSPQFIYKPFGLTPMSQAAVPDWEVVNQRFTPWVNDGNVYNCSAWTPPINLVNLDEDFTQARTCSQYQARTRVDELYSERLKQTRYEGPFGESHVISVEESQSATGTRDFITGDRENAYQDWDSVGGFYGCGGWTPDPSDIDYGTPFTQERDCSWDEHRQRNVFNTWQSGRETYLRTDVEGRTVPYIDSRSSTGTYRDWQPTSSTFTAWGDIGSDYAHSSWSPVANTQPSNFTQSRDYKRGQDRLEQFREQDQVTTDYRNTGAPVLRTQTIDRSEDRVVDVEYTPWAEVNRSLYTSWTPLPTTQTGSFGQSRKYTLTEERERSYTAAGEGELHTATESRDTIDQTENRPVVVAFTSWTETGSNYDCATWSPDRDAIGVDVDYMQTRVCNQDEVRDRVYTTGSIELNRVEEGRTLTPTQSRAQTGEGSWVSHASTLTSWVNSGGRYNYSSYSPAPTTQTSAFSQSKNYNQNQTRNEQKRERDVHSGTIRNTGSAVSRLQTIVGSESRTIDVSASSWANGATSNHSMWTPDVSSQKTSFSQSRTYSLAQSRSWTYKANEATVHTRQESRVLTFQNETREVVVTPEAWVDNSEMYSCSSWDEDVSDYYLEVSVTRSRSCSMDQVRKLTYSVNGEVILEVDDEKTIPRIESESASGTKHHTISLASCGFEDTGCVGRSIYVDGQNFYARRGWQLIVLHPVTKAIVSQGLYDSYASAASAINLESALKNVPNGYLMLLNTWDEPNRNSAYFTDELRSYLGASLTGNIASRSSYYIAGYKNGSKLAENYSPRSTSGVASGTIALN